MTRTRMDSRTRHRHETARRRFSLAIGLLCATAWAGFASQGIFEVGRRWQYRHEGPRPGSIEPNAIDGERVLWVLSSVEGQGGAQWVLEERFTRDEKAIGRFCVREDGLLEAIEIQNDKGETARLRYDPPIPYRPAGMAVGEKKTISTSLRLDSADFTLPSKIVIERLADETLATPAGEFPGCSHYRSVTTSTINIKIAKIPITEEREQWHHPAVQGMVKEIYRRGPVKFLTWSRPGYTATSTLIAYDRQEPGPGQQAGMPPLAQRQQIPQRPQGGPARWMGLLLLAAVLALVAGGFVWIRRKRNR